MPKFRSNRNRTRKSARTYVAKYKRPARKFTRSRQPRKSVGFRPRTRRGYVRKGPMRIRIKDVGMNSTFSYDMTTYRPRIPLQFKGGQRNIYRSSETDILNANDCAQGGEEFIDMSRTLMVQYLSTTNTQPTGTTLIPNQSTAYVNCFKSFMATYELVNTANTNCFLTIYTFACKKDCNTLPTQMWQIGLNQEGATTTYLTRDYGTSPLDSAFVNCYWKCKKVITHVLLPGQMHVHKKRVNYNKPISNFELQIIVTQPAYIAGWSTVDLFVIRGQGASNSLGTQTGTTQAQIALTKNLELEWTYIQDNGVTYAINDSALTGSSFQIYNQGSGTFVGEATAY